jgi:hypothetical protein
MPDVEFYDRDQGFYVFARLVGSVAEVASFLCLCGVPTWSVTEWT